MQRKKVPIVKIGNYYLARRADSPFWYILCRCRGQELTRSTGTEDVEEAKMKLAEFVTLYGDHDHVAPQQARLRTVLWRYDEHHASKRPSAAQNRKAIDAWSAFYGNARVADLTLFGSGSSSKL